MSIDLCTELARKEYVEELNKINKKYNIPYTIFGLLLNDILTEIKELKEANVQKEYNQLLEQQKQELEKSQSKKAKKTRKDVINNGRGDSTK